MIEISPNTQGSQLNVNGLNISGKELRFSDFHMNYNQLNNVIADICKYNSQGKLMREKTNIHKKYKITKSNKSKVIQEETLQL